MFERYRGNKIIVELAGGKQIAGTVTTVDHQDLRLETEDGICAILLSAIQVIWENPSRTLTEENMKDIAFQIRAAEESKIHQDPPPRPCHQAFAGPCVEAHARPCYQPFGHACYAAYAHPCTQRYIPICAQEYAQPCYHPFTQPCTGAYAQPCYHPFTQPCTGAYACTQAYGQPCTQAYGQPCTQAFMPTPYEDPCYERFSHYGHQCFERFFGHHCFERFASPYPPFPVPYPPYPYPPYPYPPYPYPPYPYPPSPFDTDAQEPEAGTGSVPASTAESKTECEGEKRTED